MKRLIILALIPLLNGCLGYHIYSGVNAVTTGTTNKSIPDHTLSLASGNDCNLFNLFKDKYYCEEPREAGTTYNRSVF